MAFKTDLEDTKIPKHILKTLTEKCDEEALNKLSTIPFSNKVARIQYYTGLSWDFIEKLVNDQPGRIKLNLASRILILNTVKGLHERSQLPSYNNIFEETQNKLRNDCDQPIAAYNVFVEEMCRLGYMLKQTVNNSMIVIEDPEVRFERFMYLQKLEKFRKNTKRWTNIVYVDERIVNLTNKYEKPDSRKQLVYSEENVFYHAVSRTGFITGMFTNKPDFKKWISEILLSLLEDPCLIIINTILYDALENIISITKHDSKKAMYEWLTGRNVPCRSRMSKPELYELIQRVNPEDYVDGVFRSQGHEVLRLPRHFQDLSITTSLWKSLESEEMDTSTSLVEKQNKLNLKIASLPEATWREYESDLIKTEAQIFEIDKMIENLSDKYELKL